MSKRLVPAGSANIPDGSLTLSSIAVRCDPSWMSAALTTEDSVSEELADVIVLNLPLMQRDKIGREK